MTTKTNQKSILDLPVAPEIPKTQPKPKPIAKQHAPRPPAPPCMATRQYNEAVRKAAEKRAKWAERVRYDNLRTPYGRTIQALIDNPAITIWPKDW